MQLFVKRSLIEILGISRMQNNAWPMVSTFREVLVNLTLHLRNPALFGKEEIERVAGQISHYLNHLLTKFEEFCLETDQIKYYLPNLEICETKHLSTAIRIWYKVIKRLAVTSRFSVPLCRPY